MVGVPLLELEGQRALGEIAGVYHTGSHLDVIRERHVGNGLGVGFPLRLVLTERLGEVILLSTVLLVIGSVTSGEGDAGSKVYTRVIQMMVAVIYVVSSFGLIERFRRAREVRV